MKELLVNVLFVIPVLLLNGWITIKMHHWNNKRRDMKFLKHLTIDNRGASTITLSSVGSTDHEALNKIKEQLDESA